MALDTQEKRMSAASQILDLTLVVPDGSIGLIIRSSETWWYNAGTLAATGCFYVVRVVSAPYYTGTGVLSDPMRIPDENFDAQITALNAGLSAIYIAAGLSPPVACLAPSGPVAGQGGGNVGGGPTTTAGAIVKMQVVRTIEVTVDSSKVKA